MTKTLAIISCMQKCWDWKDIYLVNVFTASPLSAPLVSGELPAGSSHECSPPWTWNASVFPWPHDLTCPEVTPHLLQQADHLFANDHPTSKK